MSDVVDSSTCVGLGHTRSSASGIVWSCSWLVPVEGGGLNDELEEKRLDM